MRQRIYTETIHSQTITNARIKNKTTEVVGREGEGEGEGEGEREIEGGRS